MDLDLVLALFAIRTYARRNSSFHGNSFDLFKSGKYAELAEQLDLDENNIESLVADGERPLVDKYRRLICFHRDYHICKDDAGNWRKREAPPGDTTPVHTT